MLGPAVVQGSKKVGPATRIPEEGEEDEESSSDEEGEEMEEEEDANSNLDVSEDGEEVRQEDSIKITGYS